MSEEQKGEGLEAMKAELAATEEGASDNEAQEETNELDTSEPTAEEEVVEETEPEVKKTTGVPQWRVDKITAEKKAAEEELARTKAQLAKVQELEKLGYSVSDIADYVAKQGKSPELDSHRLQREVSELNSKISQLASETELKGYLADNPEAKDYSESLITLKKAFPGKSYAELDEEILGKARAKNKVKVSVETGRGSISSEPTEVGMTPAKFSKLPVEKQREYLSRMGL